MFEQGQQKDQTEGLCKNKIHSLCCQFTKICYSLSLSPICLPRFLILKSCYVSRCYSAAAQKSIQNSILQFSTHQKKMTACNNYEIKCIDVLWFSWKMLAEIERKGACYNQKLLVLDYIV